MKKYLLIFISLLIALSLILPASVVRAAAPTFTFGDQNNNVACTQWLVITSDADSGNSTVDLDFFLDGDQNTGLNIINDNNGNNTYYLGHKTVPNGSTSFNVWDILFSGSNDTPDSRSPRQLFYSNQQLKVTAYAHQPGNWTNNIARKVVNVGPCALPTEHTPTAYIENNNLPSRPVNVGVETTFTARFGGGATNARIYVAKKPQGQGPTYCPSPAQPINYSVGSDGRATGTGNAGGEKWCDITVNDGQGTGIATGRYTFLERDTNGYEVTVTAHPDGGWRNNDPSTGCSGSTFTYSTRRRTERAWSYCGAGSAITVNTSTPPLSCTLTVNGAVASGGTINVQKNQPVRLRAYASSGPGVQADDDSRIKKMQLWYTYDRFPTPQPSPAPQITWNPINGMNSNACNPGQNCEVELDLRNIPSNPVIVECNAYMTTSGDPMIYPRALENSCAGNPWTVAANATVASPWTSTPTAGNPGGGGSWTSCGLNSYAVLNLVTSCEDSGEFTFDHWKNAFRAFLGGTSIDIPNCPGTTVTNSNALKLFNAWRRKALGLLN